jgi:hypothetical protein
MKRRAEIESASMVLKLDLVQWIQSALMAEGGLETEYSLMMSTVAAKGMGIWDTYC